MTKCRSWRFCGIVCCMDIVCESCGRGFARRGARGRVPRFCGQTCRKRASRKPKAPFAGEDRVWVRADGKRPIMVDGSPASSTDSKTWDSFGAVQSGAGNGFGVMLGSGFGCYDFDDCFEDEVLEGAVRDFITAIPEPIIFVERSVSGRGLHVFVEVEERRGFRRGGVEFYSRARFIRTTLNEFVL